MGEKSIIFITSDWDTIFCRRIGLFDSYDYQEKEDWESVSSLEEECKTGFLKDITRELMIRQEEEIYGDLQYEKKYPYREYPFEMKMYEVKGKIITGIFKEVNKGKVSYYGYEVNPKDGEVGYENGCIELDGFEPTQEAPLIPSYFNLCNTLINMLSATEHINRITFPVISQDGSYSTSFEYNKKKYRITLEEVKQWKH